MAAFAYTGFEAGLPTQAQLSLTTAPTSNNNRKPPTPFYFISCYCVHVLVFCRGAEKCISINS
jgi:hypothetical protein